MTFETQSSEYEFSESGRPQIFGADAWRFGSFLSIKSWKL